MTDINWKSHIHSLLHTSGDPNDALPALRAVVAQVLPAHRAASINPIEALRNE